VIAVIPDAGASKLVMSFGRAIEINSAVASKVRPKSKQAIVNDITGDFDGKTTAIVLDDMISSGGTVTATVEKLTEENGIHTLHPGISQDLGLEAAHQHLEKLHRKDILPAVVVTNSVRRPADRQRQNMWRVVDLSTQLKDAIQRIHPDQPVWLTTADAD
jgi:phosphoribosylpyrophosphate synthetase